MAIFAALLSATVALGACGGGDDTSSTESGTPASGTGDVTTGGTLTFARSLDAEAGLNPINAPNNGSIFTIQQIFDQLVEVQGSEIVPGLRSPGSTPATASSGPSTCATPSSPTATR